MGSVLPRKRRRKVSLTRATFGEVAVSCSLKSRPDSKGISIVLKKSGLTQVILDESSRTSFAQVTRTPIVQLEPDNGTWLVVAAAATCGMDLIFSSNSLLSTARCSGGCRPKLR